MFTEILKIKPVLDEAAAKKLTVSLNTRLMNVAKNFGKGLKAAGKGFEAIMKTTVIFAILGLFAKLMNPLNEIEERIKALLGKGTDLKEDADQLGTTSGKLQVARGIGQNLGVTPDKLQTMVESFAKAVETAEQEKKKGTPLSDSSKMVQNFIGDKDKLESFFTFLNGIKQLDPEARAKVETQFFGGTQKGATKRLIDADYGKELAGLTSSSRITKSVDKLSRGDEIKRRDDTNREINELVKGSQSFSLSDVQKMGNAADIQQERELKQMKSYEDLAKARDGIDKIVGKLDFVLEKLTVGLGKLFDLVDYLVGGKMIADVKKALKGFKFW